MAEFAFQFWERVDELRGEKTLRQIATDLGANYPTIKDMRSRCRYPKQDLCIKIANYLGTTVEYLMTGKEPEKVPVNDDYTYITKMLKDDPTLASSIANLIKSIRGEK